MVEKPERGLRGYIGSRPIRGTSFPQKLQNLTVRNYATQRGLRFKLSATEYAMPDCYMMLIALLNEINALDGIIAFSCFMLPHHKKRRAAIYQSVFESGAQLHAALENLILREPRDVARWEDLMDVSGALGSAPFHGRYEKDGVALDESLSAAFTGVALR